MSNQIFISQRVGSFKKKIRVASDKNISYLITFAGTIYQSGVCVTCKDNTIAAAGGMTSCTPCPTGQPYEPNTGHTKCISEFRY